MSWKDFFRWREIAHSCARCGQPLHDGEPFAIVGTMSASLRQIRMVRSDLHLHEIGAIRCMRCVGDSEPSPL